eukprot:4323860-Prorocentrum_lima.AAC.1
MDSLWLLLDAMCPEDAAEAGEVKASDGAGWEALNREIQELERRMIGCELLAKYDWLLTPRRLQELEKVEASQEYTQLGEQAEDAPKPLAKAVPPGSSASAIAWMAVERVCSAVPKDRV